MRQQPQPTSSGPVALVTGAGSGIGEALAATLARLGWIVVVADVDVEAATRVATATGGHARRLDVRDGEVWRVLVDEVERDLGAIGLLVNNAGIGVAGPFDALTDADWERVVDVNLMGVVHGTRVVYARMKARGAGMIVNVASGAALCPRPGMVAYAASKAAVVALTVSLRAEAAEHGIRVTAACPGYVRTRIMERTTWRGIDGASVIAAIPIAPMSADHCAAKILAATQSRRAVVPIGGGVRLEWLLVRLSPSLANWLARLRWRAFSRHRQGT